MNRKSFELKFCFLFVSIAFAFFLGLPLANLAYKSLRTGSGTGLGNYAAILTDDAFLTAFRNSFAISALEAAITTVAAFILAYGLHLTRIPGKIKEGLQLVVMMPMFLPSITYGFAVIYSFGKQGLITKLVGEQLFPIYGFWGLLISFIVYTLPPAFLVLYNAFFYIDKNFITVSKIMGDSPLRTLWMTSVRPLLGSLMAAFILSFFLSFTDFGIPVSIGGEYNMIAVELYMKMMGALPDFERGSVIAMAMLVPSVISVMLLRYMEKFNFRYNKISRYEVQRSFMRDGAFGLFFAAVALLFISVFAIMFIVPFVKSWPYQPVFTLDTLKRVLSDNSLVDVYVNSLMVAGITAVAGTVLCYAAAMVNARSDLNKYCKIIMDVIAMVTNTVPGMVLGVAFIFIFSGTPLQSTFAILIIANILHFFTTPYLMIKSSLSKMNESWETTGLLMGDTWLKTVIKVVIPNSRATICQMLSYFFVNAMVTISAIVFLAGARTMVITTKIKELQYFEKFDAVFVLSLLIFFTNVVAKTFFDKLAEQEEIPLYKKIKNLFKAKENPNEKFC